ncbi:MAG: NnrS family protein [Mariprofundaceae bacterium]|nr:NnrS family protein [Mariprofundaceae bacterium]
MLTLFSDVHRSFFSGGIIFALVSITLWVLHLQGLLPYTWAAAQAQIHMMQMIYFFFPFYFFGFLLTVFPRLMSVSAIPPHTFIPLFLLYFSGAVLFTIGLYAGEIWVQIGVSVAALGFIATVYQLLRILLHSTYPHKRTTLFMLAGTVFGLIGMLVLAHFSLTGNSLSGRVAEAIGLYGFLLPTIYAVIYRMVPMFTARSGREVTRARYGLPLVFFFSLLHMLLMAMEMFTYYWLADLGLFLTVGYQLWQWKIWHRKPLYIQSILHWSLFWFPFAFLLSAGTSFTEWLADERWLYIEQAALHALVVGGFGTLILGMTTRVTLGHAGLPVMTDTYTNILFFGFHVVPATRVISGLLSDTVEVAQTGIHVSGMIWVIFFGLWAWRYFPLYFQPHAGRLR